MHWKMNTIAEQRKKNRKNNTDKCANNALHDCYERMRLLYCKIKISLCDSFGHHRPIELTQKIHVIYELIPFFRCKSKYKYIAFFYKELFYFPKIQWNWQMVWTTLNHFHVLCFNFPPYDLNFCKFSWNKIRL